MCSTQESQFLVHVTPVSKRCEVSRVPAQRPQGGPAEAPQECPSTSSHELPGPTLLLFHLFPLPAVCPPRVGTSCTPEEPCVQSSHLASGARPQGVGQAVAGGSGWDLGLTRRGAGAISELTGGASQGWDQCVSSSDSKRACVAACLGKDSPALYTPQTVVRSLR